jgi:hypothetical protein
MVFVSLLYSARRRNRRIKMGRSTQATAKLRRTANRESIARPAIAIFCQIPDEAASHS